MHVEVSLFTSSYLDADQKTWLLATKVVVARGTPLSDPIRDTPSVPGPSALLSLLLTTWHVSG